MNFYESVQAEYLYNNFFKNKRNGVFIDIGAHDGVTGSNSCFFEREFDWSGLCVEPLTSAFNKLVQNRKKSININGCVYKTSGENTFVTVTGYSEMLSGLEDSYDPRHFERIQREINQNGGTIVKSKIICYTFNELLEKYNIKHVDFCSIDTEGSELDILKSIDIAKFDITFFSIENNFQESKFVDFFNTINYELIAKVGIDDIFRKKEII
jgi:FkbM family methyltransferase